MRRRAQSNGDPTFPGYSDLRELASGTFATVYRALEIDTSRPVALKVLKVDSVNRHLLQSFAQEIRALGMVSGHPNIVTLYRSIASPDGRPVLVLELCRESMAQRLRREGPLPPADVVATGIKIAGALESAHRAGFLHRDMKPQNILVTQYGEPALADFGVAALQASAQDTEGVFGFTTLHAPPEILEGAPLSAATDVYGLASTLYQLVAGRAPFVAFDGEAPASVILRILRDPVTPLRAEYVPVALSDLLEQALAKEPRDRPSSALALAEGLREVEAMCGWPPTTFAAFGQPVARPGRASPLPADTGPGESAASIVAPPPPDVALLPAAAPPSVFIDPRPATPIAPPAAAEPPLPSPSPWKQPPSAGPASRPETTARNEPAPLVRSPLYQGPLPPLTAPGVVPETDYEQTILPIQNPPSNLQPAPAPLARNGASRTLILGVIGLAVVVVVLSVLLVARVA